MMGLAFSGSYGYFCTGYSEGRPSISKFNISTPNKKINFFDDDGNADNNYVATDDNYVYWGAFDSNNPNNTFVHATKVSDDSPVNFSWGTNVATQFGKTYSTIAYCQFN
jgi:hypothetical protein